MEGDYYRNVDPEHSQQRRYAGGYDHGETIAYPLCDKLYCSETVWDTVEMGRPRRGFWGAWPGPGMALENACESDYLVSKYIGEFWCSLACAVMLSAGLVGLYLHRSSIKSGGGGHASGPGPALFLCVAAVGLFGFLAHVTQLRVWEALETLFLAHLTTMVALIGVAELCFRHAATPGAFIRRASRVAAAATACLAPTLYFGNFGLEAATAASTVIAQVCVAMLWLRRRVWSRYPKMLMLGAQALVIISAGIELLERAHDCDWELEMDYNDNPLNDHKLHNHLHAMSVLAMALASYLVVVFMHFSHFALKDAPVALRMEYWLIPRADLSNGKASKAPAGEDRA